jgi:hypothetical protein
MSTLHGANRKSRRPTASSTIVSVGRARLEYSVLPAAT